MLNLLVALPSCFGRCKRVVEERSLQQLIASALLAVSRLTDLDVDASFGSGSATAAALVDDELICRFGQRVVLRSAS